ncbi:MAG: TatD family hydrolase [Candidatus Bilamarchaeaceae archaeon]
MLNMLSEVAVDAHCHLDCFPEEKLRALPEGIIPVTAGYSHKSNVRNVEIAKKLHVPFTLGIAPQTAISEGVSGIQEWASFIRKNAPNAIGECGLDFHWAKSEADIEKEKAAFVKMMELAEGMGLPLVIHSRKSDKEVLDALEDFGWKGGFMMHFFSGNGKDAERALRMGGLISIIGMHAKGRREAIGRAPLEKIVVETDAPYAFRNIDGIYEGIRYVAEVKGISEKEVAHATAQNAIRFFNIER